MMKYIKHIKDIVVLLAGLNSYLYGNIEIVRLYTRFPRFLPINARIQHGWYQKLYVDDFNAGRPLMLVWSKRIAELWKEKSKIPVIILGSPFVLYRHLKNITIKNDARGTVTFPHHSSKCTDADYELEEYCKALHDLPDEYKPVTVCLYYMDLPVQGPVFEKNGLKVVTVGKPQWTGFRFVNHFYDILSQHKYSTSNTIGSYTFYSVEMGIPFFLYGGEGVSKLKPGQKKLSLDVIINSEFMERLIPLFSEMSQTISEEQRRVVFDEVGIDDAVSPKELRRLFLKNLTLSKIFRRAES